MSTAALALCALLAAAPAGSSEAPRAAARAYFAAIARGDGDAALALVVDPSDADQLAVRATAASQGGLRRLEDLATSRFGASGGLGIAARQEKLLAAIEAAPIEVSGDRATLRPDGERPVRLRRTPAGWRIESPAERLTSEERKALDDTLRRTEEAARGLAERIRSGALQTAEQAREALRKALPGREDEGVPL